MLIYFDILKERKVSPMEKMNKLLFISVCLLSINLTSCGLSDDPSNHIYYWQIIKPHYDWKEETPSIKVGEIELHDFDSYKNMIDLKENKEETYTFIKEIIDEGTFVAHSSDWDGFFCYGYGIQLNFNETSFTLALKGEMDSVYIKDGLFKKGQGGYYMLLLSNSFFTINNHKGDLKLIRFASKEKYEKFKDLVTVTKE